PHVPLEKTIGQVTPTGPVPSLAVLNSDGATLADGKLTLKGVSTNTIVFADRPVRAAGHQATAQFIEQWDEGKNSFAVDPPNATVSVLGGDGSDVSDARLSCAAHHFFFHHHAQLLPQQREAPERTAQSHRGNAGA
ncbi:MAG TPA: hypothetical protein PLD84_02770, partial [Chitinophagales bacterium]|nr:hypothetical protein [Chitinophagales bacterium]